MMWLMVAAAEYREVRHLEGVSSPAAALQRACHCVPHVEVSLSYVRRQV